MIFIWSSPEWFTFLVPAYLDCPGKEAIKQVHVCVWSNFVHHLKCHMLEYCCMCHEFSSMVIHWWLSNVEGHPTCWNLFKLRRKIFCYSLFASVFYVGGGWHSISKQDAWIIPNILTEVFAYLIVVYIDILPLPWDPAVTSRLQQPTVYPRPSDIVLQSLMILKSSLRALI